MLTETEIDDLFTLSLTGNYDDDAPWDAVAKLRSNGDRVIFERAAQWCSSQDPVKRARGSDILCQLRALKQTEENLAKAFPDTEPIFVSESFQIISQMVENEVDEAALHSELFGLGHLYQEEAVPILIPFAIHPNEEIRYAVTHSLGHFPQNTEAVATLIELTSDKSDDIRDWALFGIGTQSDLDSPKIREALAQHIDDPFQDAREEAIAGLAKRKDSRAALPMLRLMQSGSSFSHHDYEFAAFVGLEENGDWRTDNFIDVLYERFPELLLPQEANPEHSQQPVRRRTPSNFTARPTGALPSPTQG